MPALLSKKLLLSVSVLSLAFVLSGCKSENAEAATAPDKKMEKTAASVVTSDITPEYVEKIRQKFTTVRPDLKVDRIAASEVAGIYQVFFEGKGSIYMAANGDHFFSGDLFAIREQEIVNVSEEKSNGPRAELIASVDRDDMIIFSPKGETKASITVFTDVDCGYCRKLHQEVPKMNAKGIEVKYLAYPRAGIGSNSYKKIASAWCSDDRNEAISKLKAGGEIPINVCENNPVTAQFNMGMEAGVTGTPALVLANGRLIPGYMTADQLAQMLGI